MERARLAVWPDASSPPRHAADFGHLDRSVGQSQHKAPAWNSRPLCCRYLAVVFETQRVAVRNQDALRDHEARWAIGVVADGQCEVLGMWWESVLGTFDWEEVFADLTLRGVEKITFVAGSEPHLLGEATRTSYPAAKTLPSEGNLLWQSLAEVAPLTPRLRRFIRWGEDAARHLQQGLSRAVGRHSRFVDQSEAVSFVVGVLERADRRLAVPRPRLGRGDADRVESAIRNNGFRTNAVGL
jgi:hypothetical protein